MSEHTLRLPSEIRTAAYEIAVEKGFSSVMITEGESEAAQHRIVFVNDAFTEMTGYSADEVLGKTPDLMQGPKTDRQVIGALRENMSSGGVFHGTTTNYKKDGSEFTIEWKVMPVRDRRGTVTHHVAMQRDVTYAERTSVP